ncbi:hypothetical protein [Methanolacinia paynteri]|uniref:hypothetical protein n=1 Tax=Methanolacinia paynteri TaxID=230356 RepID=UPI00064F01E6|nr:hypothetical protein [Methanolacinia paynteri]
MARIGDIYIGGAEGSPTNGGKIYSSGVCFNLSKPSPLSQIYSSEDNKWEIEVIEGQPSIIARSIENIQPDDILNQGYEICQKYLDLVSVTRKENMSINNDNDIYTVLFKTKDKFVIRLVTMVIFSFNVTASATVFRDGKEVPSPPKAEVKWNPAFRYYHLSKISTNIFEAYRNLFLSLESLLSEKYPLQGREGEVKWFRRALEEINKTIPLNKYFPAINNCTSIDYFIDNQYVKFRCNLFHSKDCQSLLPFADLDQQELTSGYEELLRFWQELVNVYCNIPRGGGGITYAGFQDLMNGLFSDGFELLATDDPSLENVTDTQVSPLNHPIIKLSNLKLDANTIPGTVYIIGDLEKESLNNLEVLRRFCSKTKTDLFVVHVIEKGIYPEGIDKIEYYHGIQMRNNNLPT